MSTEPDPLQLELERAQALVDLDRYDEACTVLTQLLGREPDVAPAWTLFAIAKLELGDANVALDAARRAAALEPDDEFAHILRSEALQSLGRFAESIAAAREAVALAPDSWLTHQRLSEALVTANESSTEVFAAASRAVELAPNAVAAHLTLGAAYEMRNEHAQAERCYRHALALDPESAHAHAGLARGHFPSGPGVLQYFNAGRLAAAAGGFGDAIGADPRGGGTSAANIETAIRVFLHITSFLVSSAVGLSLLVVLFSGHSVVGRVVPPLLIFVPLGYVGFFCVSAPRESRRRALSVAFHGWGAMASYAQVISVVLLLAAAAGPSEQHLHFAVAALLAYAAAQICKRVMRLLDQLDDD